MGILNRTSNISKSKSKMPDYAKDYKNEYLFIRGIDKTCGEFVKKLGEEEIFKSPQAHKLMLHINRYLKALQIGYLSDNSEIYYEYREYFMESAGVRYLRTRCFCIRNLTRSLRSLVRFLIRQQLVRKYRTPALSMWYCVYYIHTEKFIILAAFLF